MERNLFGTLPALAALLLLATASPAFAKANPVNVTFFGNVAIDGYDTVAYFEGGRPVQGSSKFQIEWQGAKWRFTSAEHRDRFQQEPEKYAPRYGGYCAYQVAMGELVGADAEIWRIEDGKLYLFYNDEARGKWLKDIPGFIAKAEKNWPELLK